MELPEVHRAVAPVLELEWTVEAPEGEPAAVGLVAVGVTREVDRKLGLAEQVVAAFYRTPEQKPTKHLSY